MSVFVIAEIGINHNGDMNLAKKMIDNSVDAGADAVKFQKRDINVVYTKEFLESHRESPWGKKQRDQKLGLEFNEDQYKIIDDYCKNKKIEWFASAWDLNSLQFLSKFDLKFNKVASAMIVDTKLLEAIAKQGKYTFISTGMSSFIEIDNAIKIFKKHNCEYELMQCVSAYPFDDSLANLNMIKIYTSRIKGKYSEILSSENIESLDDAGFTNDTNFTFKAHEQKPLNFRLIYNKRLGYSYKIRPMIKIKS